MGRDDRSTQTQVETEDKSNDKPTSPVRPMRVLSGVFLDAGLSIVAYFGGKLLGLDDYLALLAATLVAGLRLVYVLIRTKRVDAFALFMMVIFGFSLLLSFLTGSEKFLLVKESFGNIATGLFFLISCLFGKPLIYEASKRFASLGRDELAEWDERWSRSRDFRKMFVFVSVVWGVVFLVEAIGQIPLVFVLPAPVMTTIGSLATPLLIGALLVWTLWYGPRRERRVRLAEEAATRH